MALPAALRESYHTQIDRNVCAVIADANAGRFPMNLRQWRRAGRRFSLRIKTVTDQHITEPFVRVSRDGSAGVLYLPITRSWRRRQCWLLHEVGEWAMSQDVAPAFYYPSSLGSHHDLAVVIERYHMMSGCRPTA